jgi:hypothetical protein
MPKDLKQLIASVLGHGDAAAGSSYGSQLYYLLGQFLSGNIENPYGRPLLTHLSKIPIHHFYSIISTARLAFSSCQF